MKTKIFYLIIIVALIAAIAAAIFTGSKKVSAPVEVATSTIPANMSVSGELGG